MKEMDRASTQKMVESGPMFTFLFFLLPAAAAAAICSLVFFSLGAILRTGRIHAQQNSLETIKIKAWVIKTIFIFRDTIQREQATHASVA